jgi:dUTP pyrophosphatase
MINSVKIKRLNEKAKLPVYATSGSVGFDFYALEDTLIPYRAVVTVGTGLAFSIPEGYEMQVRPRSGISLKTKLRVILGTIDSDYRGEVKVIVENCGESMAKVCAGERIAQGIIAPIVKAKFEEVEDLDETLRGDGGFGSSGMK